MVLGAQFATTSGVFLTLKLRVANWVSLMRQPTKEMLSMAKEMGGFGWMASTAADTKRPLAYASSTAGVSRTVLMLTT